MDAGPVVGGYGVAACAFGVGAARAMGRFDHAYALAAQAIVFSWPLPSGTLLVPRVLSNLSDAPYLGEAATLFALTRMPVEPPKPTGGSRLPWSVCVGILLSICLGAYEVLASVPISKGVFLSTIFATIGPGNVYIFHCLKPRSIVLACIPALLCGRAMGRQSLG